MVLLVLFCSSGPLFFLPLNLKLLSISRRVSLEPHGMDHWSLIRNKKKTVVKRMDISSLIWKMMAQTRALKYLVFGTLNFWYCIHITDETKGERPNAGHKLPHIWVDTVTLSTTRSIVCTRFLRSEETNFGGSTLKKSGSGEKCAGLF